MTEERSKKTNFFKDVLKSIKDLDKYEDYAIELPTKALKYLLKLVLVFCIIVSVCYTYQTVQGINNTYENLKNILPDFLYENGVLKINSENPVVIEDYKDAFGTIVIDTENTFEKYEKNEDINILFLKDKCIMISKNSAGNVTYNYEELAESYGVTKFNKQDMINTIDNTNKVSLYASIFCIMYLYLFVVYFIAIFMDVLLLAVLAYFVSRISRIRLKLAPSFGIAIHAITLPVVLNLIYIVINLFTGFRINYFQLMYNTISYIYVIVAILMIKTDFIQRQVELMKLAQEQEKIRAEMQQKEEKEKKEKENPEENQRQNENKDTKKKKDSEGENEAGANAPACEELGE